MLCTPQGGRSPRKSGMLEVWERVESRDRTENDGWIRLLQHFESQTKPFHDPCAHALNHDICLCGQSKKFGAAFFGYQVDNHAFLAPIPAQMQVGIAIAATYRVGAAASDRVAPLRILDLYDASAKVSKPASQRVGSIMGDLDNDEIGKEVESHEIVPHKTAA